MPGNPNSTNRCARPPDCGLDLPNARSDIAAQQQQMPRGQRRMHDVAHARQILKARAQHIGLQGIARIFGQNLKDDYDVNGEDVWIENIVALIEDGTIPVADKSVDAFGIGRMY